MSIKCEDILLIVVNYNQSLEIENFLKSLVKYWPIGQTLLVDDGSVDNSPKIAKDLGYNCIEHKRNKGVGAAIRTGIFYAKNNQFKAVVIMSSNGKMVPSQIERVVGPLVAGKADYVTGSRFLQNGESPGLTFFRRCSIPIFSLICTILLGRKFSDITCGFRCYRIDFLFQGHCDIDQDWLSRYELEYYIHFWACRLGLKIQEVSVTIRYDHLKRHRLSKIRPVVDWWSMLRPLIFLRLGLRK